MNKVLFQTTKYRVVYDASRDVQDTYAVLEKPDGCDNMGNTRWVTVLNMQEPEPFTLAQEILKAFFGRECQPSPGRSSLE